MVAGLQIQKDKKFCNTKDCIHRRGCRKWLGNYIGTFEPLEWINEIECKNEDGEEDYDGYALAYIHLDRYKYSDGSSMK